MQIALILQRQEHTAGLIEEKYMIQIEYTSPKHLEELMEQWNDAYHNGQPIVEDTVFDHYKGVLRKEFPSSSFLKTVGAPPKRNKEILPYLMGSLANKTMENIDSWLERKKSKNYVLSHKLDGIGIEIEYIDGILKNAWLRGDGTIGENITKKAEVFCPTHLISNTISADFINSFVSKNITVVGEILLNCEPETLGYKNKRNSVSGIVHRDDTKHLQHLYVVIHGLKNPDPLKLISKNEGFRFDVIYSLFPSNTVRYKIVKSEDVISEAQKMIEETTQYDKDGIVICVEECEVEHVKLPENKIALKFQQQVAETEVLKVEWNVSRTGKLIPLVYVSPVEVGGITIGKATGFNAKFILDSDIDIGTKIKIIRSGDVIPYIDSVISGHGMLKFPQKCPCCDSLLVSEGVHLVCKNMNCPDQIRKTIAYFFMKMGLEFFSEKMISSLNCKTIFDIFELKENDIQKIEGWGETSSKDFIRRIEEIKLSSPEKILSSLGIPHLGTTTCKAILPVISFNDLIEGIQTNPEQINTKILSIKGFAKKKADSIVNGLIENMSLLERLKEVGVRYVLATGTLTGKKFCITGSLSKPRKEVEKMITDLGGDNVSITKCDYLICNESSNSAKYKQAAEKGIRIITEDKFIEMTRGV